MPPVAGLYETCVVPEKPLETTRPVSLLTANALAPAIGWSRTPC